VNDPPLLAPVITRQTVNGNTVRSFCYARTTVRSERKLDHCLTLCHPINTTFGLLGSWFGPEVALNWLFPYPLITRHHPP
jgi:hypothetical protein